MNPTIDAVVVQRAIEDGKCPMPECPSVFRDRNAARDHMRLVHEIVSKERKRRSIVEGEQVLIGGQPLDVLTITFQQGRARRKIETWMIPMAKAFDLVAGVLRQELSRGK